MARKNVLEELGYHERGNKNTIIQCGFIISVNLHRSDGSSKVSVPEKIPQ